MKLKKLGKVILIVGAGVVCLLAAGIVCVFLFLLSPYEIKESLSTKSETRVGQTTVAKSLDSNVPIAAGHVEGLENSETDADPTSLKESNAELGFAALVDTGKPLSEVCQNLNDIKIKQMGKLGSAEFGARFENSLLGKSSDPLMASLTPVLKLALTQPSMLTLISRVQQAQPDERASVMNKMDFYSSAYDAYLEMIKNKKNMERVVDQSYLTMMLGRVLEVRPELARDSQVLAYCQDIERILNEGTATDFTEEKKQFLNFLADTEVDPKAIGFDPNYQTDLQIEFNKNGLHFNGGWIDEVFAQIAPKTNAKQ